MNFTNTVVIVDPYSSGNQYANAFLERGFTPVAVLSSPFPPDVYSASFHPADFSLVLRYENNTDVILKKLAELRPRAVIAGTESGVELADIIAASVCPDLSNDPDLKECRRDKGFMGDRIRELGLNHIRQICTDDLNEVMRWISDNNLSDRPLVIKPPKSAGTDSVIKVTDRSDIAGSFNAVLHKKNKLDIINERVLVQEFVAGREFVIDTFSADGVHYVSNVCEYKKASNKKQMAVYESLEWLSEEDPVLDKLLPYNAGVLDALGVRFGCAHMEVMLDGNEVKLIEVGMRLHGGGHPVYNRLATGSSQLDHLVNYICTGAVPPEKYVLHKKARVIFLMNRQEAVVRNIHLFDNILHLNSYVTSFLNIKEGDRIMPTNDLFSTFSLGIVILANDSEQELQSDSEAVRLTESRMFIPVSTAAPDSVII